MDLSLNVDISCVHPTYIGFSVLILQNNGTNHFKFTIILRLNSNINQCRLFMVKHKKHWNSRWGKLQSSAINRICVKR